LEHAGLQFEHALQTEMQTLSQANLTEKLRELERARGSLETLAAHVEQEANALAKFAEHERVAPDSARQELAEARAHATQVESYDLMAKQALARLQAEELKLSALQDERRVLLKTMSTWDAVVKFTGRDFLQRHLVRTAEHQIVEHANVVLDRLSRGELSLKEMAGEATTAEKAFDLEVTNRNLDSRPMPVGFLSGSQKFRVAVSLALGIGRYASRQHRPIESVIIDEGFGCLDQEGLQTVNQELEALRGALDRVILVSHQEAIAKAIPHGYHFERVQGATVVTRRLPD
jgi:DNA repair exonuclease SbcCD ATPase subunit